MMNDKALSLNKHAEYMISFISMHSGKDQSEYDEMAAQMVDIAVHEYGCLGVHSARGGDGVGITNSYWPDMASIKSWKNDERHKIAQNKGREKWYDSYRLVIAKISHHYGKEGA